MKCVAVLRDGTVCGNNVDPAIVWDHQLVYKSHWPAAREGFYARVPLCPICMERLRRIRNGKVA